jgi:hypothetical protein
LVAESLSRVKSGQGVKLTTQLQLVRRSRVRESIYPFPQTPSWCSTWLVKRRENFTIYKRYILCKYELLKWGKMLELFTVVIWQHFYSL